MEAVKSRDGTPIAYERAGSGPPLVLVHGSTSDHGTAYRYVIPMLERYFTVRALDRRGRGDSGDGLDRERRRAGEPVWSRLRGAGRPRGEPAHRERPQARAVRGRNHDIQEH